MPRISRVDDYLKYLCHEVGASWDDWEAVFRAGFEVDYRWDIPIDEDRAIDGIAMRRYFEYDTGRLLPENVWKKPCSMIEMIAALDIRGYKDLLSGYDNMSPEDIFLYNMHSLGIKKRTKNEEIIKKKFLQEEKNDGEGGLFWVKNCEISVKEQEVFWKLTLALDEILG